MDKFVALPIRGEAFLLSRAGKTVLVDGGYRTSELEKAVLAEDPSLRQINVVVCTHADMDHAGGLAGLSQHIAVEEFWLPGSWADVVPELLHQPGDVTKGLIRELDAFVDSGQPMPTDAESEEIERYFHLRASTERKDVRAPDRSDDGQFSESGEAASVPTSKGRPLPPPSVGNSDAKRIFASARGAIGRRVAKKIVPKSIARYWSTLISTAERIRKIAEVAIDHGSTVRWFDFSAFARSRIASGGEADLLVPLNSVELQFPAATTHLSYLARLTPVNEECLVFLAPPDFDHLGVVFCGDSPLGLGPGYADSIFAGKRSSGFGLVATAPHHGSESNAIAYRHLQAWSPVVTWVRAG